MSVIAWMLSIVLAIIYVWNIILCSLYETLIIKYKFYDYL